jgi:hypothetical protein
LLDGRLKIPILKTSKVLSLLSDNESKARRQQGYTLSQIAKAIGLNHYSAVNSAIRRMNDDDISLAGSMASDVTRDKI